MINYCLKILTENAKEEEKEIGDAHCAFGVTTSVGLVGIVNDDLNDVGKVFISV